MKHAPISPTPRQAAILQLIAEHITRLGRAPTIRELGRVLGIHSTNGIECHLKGLAARDLIERDDGYACGTRVYGQVQSAVLAQDGRILVGSRILTADEARDMARLLLEVAESSSRADEIQRAS